MPARLPTDRKWVPGSPDLPVDVQRRVASFTTEGGKEVRRGDAMFGRGRGLRKEQRKCVCALCVSMDAGDRCSLFEDDGGVRLVKRTSAAELCLPVCMSRDPLRMLLRFIRVVLREVVARIPEDLLQFVHITLQRVDSTHTRPYVVDALFDGDELELDFLREHQRGQEAQFTLTYAVGDRIPAGSFPPSLSKELERVLIESNGKAHSLVVVAPSLDARPFSIGDISFNYQYGFGFRASPLYVFTQASEA